MSYSRNSDELSSKQSVKPEIIISSSSSSEESSDSDIEGLSSAASSPLASRGVLINPRKILSQDDLLDVPSHSSSTRGKSPLSRESSFKKARDKGKDKDESAEQEEESKQGTNSSSSGKLASMRVTGLSARSLAVFRENLKKLKKEDQSDSDKPPTPHFDTIVGPTPQINSPRSNTVVPLTHSEKMTRWMVEHREYLFAQSKRVLKARPTRWTLKQVSYLVDAALPAYTFTNLSTAWISSQRAFFSFNIMAYSHVFNEMTQYMVSQEKPWEIFSTQYGRWKAMRWAMSTTSCLIMLMLLAYGIERALNKIGTLHEEVEQQLNEFRLLLDVLGPLGWLAFRLMRRLGYKLANICKPISGVMLADNQEAEASAKFPFWQNMIMQIHRFLFLGMGGPQSALFHLGPINPFMQLPIFGATDWGLRVLKRGAKFGSSQEGGFTIDEEENINEHTREEQHEIWISERQQRAMKQRSCLEWSDSILSTAGWLIKEVLPYGLAAILIYVRHLHAYSDQTAEEYNQASDTLLIVFSALLLFVLGEMFKSKAAAQCYRLFCASSRDRQLSEQTSTSATRSYGAVEEGPRGHEFKQQSEPRVNSSLEGIAGETDDEDDKRYSLEL